MLECVEACLPDNEPPTCRARGRSVYSDQNGGNHEEQRVDQVTSDQRPTPADLVNKQDARCLREQGENAVDGLVFQRVLSANPHLGINCDAIILDGLQIGISFRSR